MTASTPATYHVDGSVDWSRALAAIVADPDQPTLVAQPIVELAGARIAGYELLSRFTVGPEASPDVWFAHADQLGYAPALTARVINRASGLRASLPPDTFLTVNVEPHLVSHPVVRDALHADGRLDRLVIELTEHIRAPDERMLLTELDEIRAAGGLIAVDDAGTGYAGLGQLLLIRPDIVKLDRDLITRVDADPIRRAIVQLLGNLTGRMNGWLLAEGVETAAELRTLASLDVPLAQGWLLGRPVQPWSTLDPSVIDLVRGGTQRVGPDAHVAHLVRSCPTVQQASVVLAAFCAEEPGTAIVDATGRPLGVVVADPSGRSLAVPTLTVAPSSAPPDLLRRALARPQWQRGNPLACTDVTGRLIGLIDVAELSEATIGPVDR